MVDGRNVSLASNCSSRMLSQIPSATNQQKISRNQQKLHVSRGKDKTDLIGGVFVLSFLKKSCDEKTPEKCTSQFSSFRFNFGDFYTFGSLMPQRQPWREKSNSPTGGHNHRSCKPGQAAEDLTAGHIDPHH